MQKIIIIYIKFFFVVFLGVIRTINLQESMRGEIKLNYNIQLVELIVRGTMKLLLNLGLHISLALLNIVINLCWLNKDATSYLVSHIVLIFFGMWALSCKLPPHMRRLCFWNTQNTIRIITMFCRIDNILQNILSFMLKYILHNIVSSTIHCYGYE